MKATLLLAAMLAGLSIQAQRIPPRIYSVINGFVLDSKLETYANSLEFTDSFTYNGKTEYHYVNRFNPPCALAGVNFNDVILTFDEQHTLIRIELAKVYSDRLFKDPVKEWKDNREILHAYLEKETGSKGKKMIAGSMRYYQWVNKGHRIRFFSQHHPAANAINENYALIIVWQHNE
jgi:hypothetical protein